MNGNDNVKIERGNGAVIAVTITDARFADFKKKMAERDLSKHPIFGKGVQ